QLGRFGWLMSVAFFCLGAAALALFGAARQETDNELGRFGVWGLLIISVAYFLAGTFAPDPDWLVGSVLHGVGGLVVIFGSPIVLNALGRRTPCARTSFPAIASIAFRKTAFRIRRRKMRRIAEKLAECALNGEPWAISQVADRIDGKATAEIQTEQRHRYVIEAPAQLTREQWIAEDSPTPEAIPALPPTITQ